ncbi:MAG: right-handed parallel beta-helix repeat-containing protein [Lachnospira sp.]|nr:right-handed parallel beta-helix repeat-containing protein [Lachnospira sp.]
MCGKTGFMKLMSLCILLGLLLLGGNHVKAAGTKEVTISPSDYNGGKAIQEAFDLQKGDKPAYDLLTVTLKPGTYRIEETFLIYSNTKLVANDCNILYVRSMTGKNGVEAPILTNACSGKKGYYGAGNISIEGGTWDFQGSNGEVNYTKSLEAFRFLHGSGFALTNLTMKNLYQSHFITIEGVEKVTISGCTFQNQVDIDSKKEAIHIDCMHNDSMAPSNQENVVYDDTICNDVTVTGCSFDKVPRGVGTHIAVAGLYPSNIVITDNSFRNITYEAIKAYHYKNVTITGNVIQNAGCGIKYYLYADPDDNDKDEEGDSNYLDALKGTTTEGVPSNLAANISNNMISDITAKTNGFGIQLAGINNRIMKGVTISGNTISMTNKAMSTRLAGIYLKYANNCRVARNTVKKSQETGLLIANCQSLTLSNNTLVNIQQDALLVKDSKSVTCSGNIVNQAVKHGIYTEKTKGAKLCSNRITGAKEGGICANKGCPKIQIDKNTIKNSGKDGIDVMSCQNAKITGNQVNTVKKLGIFLDASNGSNIKKNVVEKTKDNGIVVQSSSKVNVTANTVKNAGKYGILFNKTKTSKGSKNKITNAKNYALNYSSNSKNAKWNLKFIGVTAKKGTKTVTGSTTRGLKVSVQFDKKKKTYTKALKPNGSFSISVPAMKKGSVCKVQLKDKLGNVAIKTIKVK